MLFLWKFTLARFLALDSGNIRTQTSSLLFIKEHQSFHYSKQDHSSNYYIKNTDFKFFSTSCTKNYPSFEYDIRDSLHFVIPPILSPYYHSRLYRSIRVRKLDLKSAEFRFESVLEKRKREREKKHGIFEHGKRREKTRRRNRIWLEMDVACPCRRHKWTGCVIEGEGGREKGEDLLKFTSTY